MQNSLKPSEKINVHNRIFLVSFFLPYVGLLATHLSFQCFLISCSIFLSCPPSRKGKDLRQFEKKKLALELMHFLSKLVNQNVLGM